MAADHWNRRFASWDERLLRFLTPQRLSSLPSVWRYGLAVVIVLAATVLRWVLIPWMGTVAPYNLSVVATLVTVILLGFGPGLLSVVSGDVAVEAFVLKSTPMLDATTLLRLGASIAIGVFICGIFYAVQVAYARSRRSEGRLAAFAAATFEGIIESEGGRILDCNEQFALMAGATVADLKGTAIVDLVVPEDRERVGANIRDNRESVTEHTALRRDGTRIVVEAHGRPIAAGGNRRHTAVRDLTARRQTDEKLRENEARLRLAQVSAGAGMWDWDIPNGKLEWSEELFRLFGLDSQKTDASFEFWRSVLHPEDKLLAEKRIETAIKNRSQLTSEYRIVLPSGEVRWISALGNTIYDDCGAPQRMSGICFDITDRKRAEERLFTSNQRLQALMEALPVGVSFSDDPTCQRITGNPFLLKQFEITPRDNISASAPDADAPGRQVHYLRDGSAITDAELPLQRAVAEKQPISPMELEVVLPSGRRWLAEASGAPILDAQGDVIGGVEVTVDITERRRAEEALRRSEALREVTEAVEAERRRLFDVLEALPAMISLLTPDYHVAFANRSFREKFGESNGRHCYEYCFGRTEPCDFCESYTALKTGRPHHWEMTAADGTVIEAHDYPFTDADGSQLVLEMDMDITEHRRAEKELRSAHADQAARAAQLRALAGELTLTEQRERRRMAKVLHDHIQQLLVGAKFRVAILGRAGDDVIREGAREVEELIDQCISASRSLIAELSPPILHEAGLRAGLEWLARWMADKHGLFVELAMEQESPLLAEHIKLLLFESVRELLFNAVKHSHTRSAAVSVRRVNGQVQVVVSDQGAGFDPKAVPRAGEEGGGFGLFSIRERLDLIGGRLEIDSAPGRGCRVAVRVPGGEPPAALAPQAAVEPSKDGQAERVACPSTGAKTRVLLADDHAVMREGLRQLLGHEPDIQIVGEAADGHEAVDLAGKLLPDVILMDLSMPKLNGIEATRMIHDEYPDVRIIGLSMFEEAERAQALRDAGAAGFVTKTGPSSQLTAAIRAAAAPQSAREDVSKPPAKK